MSTPLTPSLRRAFTLIELLVVITIIAILIAVLIPSLERARAQAQLVTCRSNLRQVYLGDVIYQNDYRTWMPLQQESEFCYQSSADTPKFRTYWDDKVSWCPTMDHMQPGPIAGAPRWDNRNIFGDIGYYRPKYSYSITVVWLHEFGDDPSTPKFVRNPDRQMLGAGTNWPQSYVDAFPTDVARAIPAAMDILYAYPQIPTAVNSTSAHARGPTIRPGAAWLPPSGANVLWPDGVVEFKPWQESRDPVTDEWLYVVTSQISAEEGFAYLISGTSYIPFSRRGQRF